MKTSRSCAVLTALMLGTLVLAACTPKRKVLSDEEAYKRFVGTWVNTEYPGTLQQSQVTVIRPDYVGEDWLFPTSTAPAGRWTIKVKKTWVDAAGNTYCQSDTTRTEPETELHSAAALMRVDKEGDTWEFFTRGAGRGGVYPEEIDTGSPSYYVYYRTK